MANPERRDPLAILKEGFLEKTKCNKLSQLISGGKKDDFFLKWDTCYWILRETLLLEGYKTNSKSSKDMVKTINLNHCENISVCDFTGKREYVFKLSVYVKGRTKEYLFNAKSEKERDLWVSAIVNVCDLDPDDDTYEWLDVNFTPNDRYLMEKRKKQEGNYSGIQMPSFPPPLPPRLPQGQGFHKSLMSLDESALSSALTRPPLPSRNKMFGSSDNLDLASSSSFNDRGGYGFLKTMPHSNSPKHIHSSYASTGGDLSDSSEEGVDDIYDDSIFEEVTYPGQGGKAQLVSELISNDPTVVKASFSKPSRQDIHPGDRPPLPIPYEVSRRSPIPIRMASPPSPPPRVKTLAPHSHPMPLPQRNTPRDGGMVPRSVKQEDPSKMPPSPPIKHVSRVNSPPPFGSDGVSSELQQLLSKRQTGLHNPRVGEDLTKSSFTPPQPAGKKKAILPPPSKQPPKETSPEQVDNGRSSPTFKKGYINCRDTSFVDGSRDTNHLKQRTTSNSTRNSSASSTASDTPRYPFDVESSYPPSPTPAFPVSCDDTTTLSSSQPNYQFSNQLTSQVTNLSSSQPSNFRSKLSTLDGKSLFEQPSPTTSKAEPIYVNWPIPDDLKGELEPETEDSSAPPVPSRGNRVRSKTPSSGDETSTPVKTKRTSNKPNGQQQGESRNSPQMSRQARTPESSPKWSGGQVQLKPIQEDTSRPNVRKKPPLPSKTTDKPNTTPKPVHFGLSDSVSPVRPIKPKVAPSRNELNYNSSQQPSPHKTQQQKPSYQHSSHASKSSVADKVARFNSELM